MVNVENTLIQLNGQAISDSLSADQDKENSDLSSSLNIYDT